MENFAVPMSGPEMGNASSVSLGFARDMKYLVPERRFLALKKKPQPSEDSVQEADERRIGAGLGGYSR